MPNPNSLNYLHYQDIQISDTNIKQQFINYINEGQFASALNLLSNNEDQLTGKAFVANTINTIINMVSTLQQYYNTNVTLYLSNLLLKYNKLINEFKNKGTWSSDTQYNPYNFVLYNDELYMCISTPPVGTLPSVNYYWLYLGLQGLDGSPGIDVNMTYDWNSGASYQPNDIVLYNGNLYCAKTENTNVVPTDSDAWVLFLTIGEGKINIGVTPPSFPSQGMIWFQPQTDPEQSSDSSPIIGQFQQYNSNLNSWEIMYPNTLFTWIDGINNNYTSLKNTISVTIDSYEWENGEWTYSDPRITNNSIIEIWPDNLTNTQSVLYNSLTLQISDNSIRLSTLLSPSIDLPIIIYIQ